jgi:hypothetical protein
MRVSCFLIYSVYTAILIGWITDLQNSASVDSKLYPSDWAVIRKDDAAKIAKLQDEISVLTQQLSHPVPVVPAGIAESTLKPLLQGVLDRITKVTNSLSGDVDVCQRLRALFAVLQNKVRILQSRATQSTAVNASIRDAAVTLQSALEVLSKFSSQLDSALMVIGNLSKKVTSFKAQMVSSPTNNVPCDLLAPVSMVSEALRVAVPVGGAKADMAKIRELQDFLQKNLLQTGKAL